MRRVGIVKHMLALRPLAALTLAALVVGVLAFPASSAPKGFDFQGSGDPPVKMTMTGKRFDEPKRVTDFSISPGLSLYCPGYGEYPVPDPLVAPIQQGIKLKRTKHGLEFKRWAYDS